MEPKEPKSYNWIDICIIASDTKKVLNFSGSMTCCYNIAIVSNVTETRNSKTTQKGLTTRFLDAVDARLELQSEQRAFFQLQAKNKALLLMFCGAMHYRVKWLLIASQNFPKIRSTITSISEEI